MTAKTLTYLHATEVLARNCPVSVDCLWRLEQMNAIDVKAGWSPELSRPSSPRKSSNQKEPIHSSLCFNMQIAIDMFTLLRHI